MRIEHIAMYVNDLEKEKEFFELYFGAKAGENMYMRKLDSVLISWSFRMEQGWN